MAINKIPKNYYSDTNIRRDKINELIDEVNDIPAIPTPTAEDVGKVIKINDSGAYALSDDLHTPVVANPDVETSERLEKLTVGTTTYLVNEALPITEIKAIKIIGKSMQGTDANIVLRKPIKLSNQYTGDIYSYQTGDTVSCNIETATGLQNLITNGGNAECYIPAANLPIIIDIAFANTVNIDNYNIISIGCGAYQNASFKDVEVQISLDGTNFVSVLENPDIGYAREDYREVGKMYEVVPEIPTPTAADAGKVLGVDSNGAWELDNILPTVTSADVGKVLTVDNNGAWGAGSLTSKVHTMLLSMNNVTFNPNTNKYSGLLTLKVDGTTKNYTSTSGEINIDVGALFAIFIYTTDVIALRGIGFNFNVASTTRTCIERVLQNCAFFNDLDNKMYKITNITGSSTSQNFEFELVELSA